MLNDNKTCIVCGTHYKYCEGCPTKYNVKETWRNLFCSERCRSVYHIYDHIRAGKVSDKEASKSLRDIDTSYFDSLKEPIRSVLIGAMNMDKKVSTKENSSTSKGDEDLGRASTSPKRGRHKKN